jgi:hypothetical protein
VSKKNGYNWMIMKFRLPWPLRLAGLLVVLNGVPAYLYMNPYFFFGGYEKLTRPHFKRYEHVHYKKEEDVQVGTDESKSFYNQLREGRYPLPQHSSFPSDEEIEQHGLFIIGKEQTKKESE